MLKRLKKNRECGDGAKQCKKISARTVGMIALLVLVTAVVFAVYRCLLNFYYFEAVLIGYMVAATALIAGYLIYNRGLSRRGLTAEMLPGSWSEEKKKQFMEDGERRFQKSKWLLIPIFAFLFTFFYDVIELLLVPCIQDFFR